MQYKRLGNSSLVVSTLSFGCMSLKQDNRDSQYIIDSAIASGINLFDTADLYEQGYNETMLGEAVKTKRKELILATKVGNQWREDGSGWDWNPRKSYIIKAAEQSLKRLQTDYIDLYQLHGGTIEDNIDETIEAFEDLKQQGKIRYYGISSIRPAVIEQYVKRSNIISVMMQYSLLDRRPEAECLDLLQANNIGLLCRGTLAQGLLSGKTAKPYLGHSEEQVELAAKSVRFVASKRDTTAGIALQFVMKHPAVTSVVAGIRTVTQLNDLLNVFEIPELNSFEYNYLKNAVKALHYG